MRLTLFALLVAASCAPAGEEASAQSVAQGERLAQTRCAACHAVGRTGASPRGNAPAFRDLHNRYPVDQLAESLAEGIVTGHPDMPEASFDQAEVASLIAYLRSLER
ncbi:cytochrome c [Roseomonas sp. CAU 1739]|uniref:c-type cytochrome n=1 Tax=Roseomonas sp. CAU 1739 TaxID=3140364 RepID=UPI00325B3E99